MTLEKVDESLITTWESKFEKKGLIITFILTAIAIEFNKMTDFRFHCEVYNRPK